MRKDLQACAQIEPSFALAAASPIDKLCHPAGIYISCRYTYWLDVSYDGASVTYLIQTHGNYMERTPT